MSPNDGGPAGRGIKPQQNKTTAANVGAPKDSACFRFPQRVTRFVTPIRLVAWVRILALP